MEISRVCYAQSTLPESWIFDGGDENKAVPILFSVFVVRTATRTILIDVGCETIRGFEMVYHKHPLEALRESGVSPEDITDVVITHAHHDHIACVKCFPHACVHIQEDEYESGKAYLTANKTVERFRERKRIENGVEIVKIGSHSKGSCVVECVRDDATYVLCGDECYSLYNIEHRVPTANPYSKENSQRFIDTYATDAYRCLVCHDQ